MGCSWKKCTYFKYIDIVRCPTQTLNESSKKQNEVYNTKRLMQFRTHSRTHKCILFSRMPHIQLNKYMKSEFDENAFYKGLK